MDVCFQLPHIGDLTLEHVFYALGETPILFVCKDSLNSRYLCSCCHLDDEWVVGQIDKKILIDLINDRCTIRDAFTSNRKSSFLVLWDGDKFQVELNFLDEALPKPGAYLELEKERIERFQKALECNGA